MQCRWPWSSQPRDERAKEIFHLTLVRVGGQAVSCMVTPKTSRETDKCRIIGRKIDMQHAKPSEQGKGGKNLKHSQQRRTALATLLSTTERGGRLAADRQAAVKKDNRQAGPVGTSVSRPLLSARWSFPGKDQAAKGRCRGHGPMTRENSTSEQPSR